MLTSVAFIPCYLGSNFTIPLSTTGRLTPSFQLHVSPVLLILLAYRWKIDGGYNYGTVL